MQVPIHVLHARLPRVSPAEAEARNRLLAALEGINAGEGRLRVRAAGGDGTPIAMSFATGAGRLGLAPEVTAGQPVRALDPHAPDLPETLLEMSRLEPLIAAVERACGRPLEPRGFERPDAGDVAVRLELVDAAGHVIHAARLYAPEPLALAFPLPTRRRLGAAARARTPCRLSLAGPLAPRGELAGLMAGDFVVAPLRMDGRASATLQAGVLAFRGGFDSGNCAFQVHQEDTGMLEAAADAGSPGEIPGAEPSPSGSPKAADAARVAELPVRLQIVLPALELSVGALAALAPGSVVTLPIPGEDFEVELAAEGGRVASGRLVSLGSAYGVLIDQVAER